MRDGRRRATRTGRAAAGQPVTVTGAGQHGRERVDARWHAGSALRARLRRLLCRAAP